MKIEVDLEMIVHLLEYYGDQLYLYRILNQKKAENIKNSIRLLSRQLEENGYDSIAILKRIDTKLDLSHSEEPVYAYVDGAARGSHDNSIDNKSAVAIVIYDNNDLVYKDCHIIEPCSSVEAEYKALIECLQTLLENGYRKRNISLYSDYKPIVRQLEMRYKASNPKLITLRDKARSLIERFSFINIEYIPREGNAYADMLVNQALDKIVVA